MLPARRPPSEPCLRIERLVVVQVQPALDDTVQRPDPDQAQDEKSDHHQDQREADQVEDQRTPEGADLPLEMRLVTRSDHVRAPHVVDDDRDHSLVMQPVNQ